MEKCDLCNGTGKAEFIDMTKLPMGSSKLADCKLSFDICPDCNGIGQKQKKLMN